MYMSSDPPVVLGMKTFIGAKLIKAVPMCEFEAMQHLSRELDTEIDKDGNSREGYLVEYEDGYQSWSPKDVFETAYREIEPIKT